MLRRNCIKVLSILGIALAVALIASSVLYAQETITLSTTFTGITSMPGEKKTFTIRVDNGGSTSKNVNLDLLEAPENWSATIRGHGSEIHKMYIRGNDFSTFDLEVQAPQDVEAGTYRFVVEAAAEGTRSTLPIEIRVKEGGDTAARLTSEYPVLSGSSGTEFKYRVNLINDSAHEQMFSLMADTPPGWSVVFQPSYRSEQVASISVEAGSTQGLDVVAKPPKIIKSGEYPIAVGAVGSLTSASVDLTAVITGSYQMDLGTPSGRLSTRARAGEDNLVTLQVVNSGTGELNNITFSASSPRNWDVSFEPKTIDRLQAGEITEVKAFIRPDSKAIAGDYALTIRSNSDETADSADFRITVLTPTLWGIIGIGIVILVLIGIFLVFKVYGRR